MKNEKDIIKRIVDLEGLYFDLEESYLDEAQQSSLISYYEILNRDLSSLEKDLIIQKRKENQIEFLGEVYEESLPKNSFLSFF